MYGLSFLPDSVYISLFYKATTGEWPNLRHPSGYNEKLQWLKIHDRHLEYRNYVDKLRVRKIIKKKIGKTYLFPLLGHWDCFDMDYNWLHIQNGCTESKEQPEKPSCFNEMKELAGILSEGMKQVRVDFY